MTHWRRRKLVRWTGGALLAGALHRLCLPAMANTSIVGQEAVIDEPRATDDRAKVALLLPLQSSTQRSAALAVHAGVMAAHAYDGLHMAMTTIETSDTPAAILRAYATAVPHYDAVIGPLSRDAVDRLVSAGVVAKPTIALAYPEGATPRVSTQAGLLMMGLPVEEEARHVAYWMHESATGGDTLVVYTSVTWQQRAAQAWTEQAKKLGMHVMGVQLPLAGLALDPKALQALQRKLGATMPSQIFMALSVTQAQQFRQVVGSDRPMYGTSHLNPFIVDRHYGQTYPLLDGVRFLDIPWQLAGSSAVSARYPHPLGYFGARPTADQRRLYALGIDAYRIAQEVVQGHSGFDLDGVTGQLTVALQPGDVTYFQRDYTRAEFRHGSVVAIGRQSS